MAQKPPLVFALRCFIKNCPCLGEYSVSQVSNLAVCRWHLRPITFKMVDVVSKLSFTNLSSQLTPVEDKLWEYLKPLAA